MRLLSQFREIGGEDILAEDGDTGLIGEVGLELRGERGVELNGEEAPGAAGKDVRDGAPPWSDFDDGAFGNFAESVGDGGLRGRADEEVLAEPGAIADIHGAFSDPFERPLTEDRGARLQTINRACFPQPSWVVGVGAGISLIVPSAPDSGRDEFARR